jgi:KaiC/GvpD/RAD55 family RecA-like ATPase
MIRLIKQKAFCKVSSIQGFSDLFGSASAGEVPFGSTILMSGPPGAGKTTFALAMVKAMMAEARIHGAKEKTICYYISSEVNEKKLRANFSAFGWFSNGETDNSGAFKFTIDSPVPDETNFYAITPMPEVDRPVPSPEELVNGIFNRIARTLLPSESPTEHATIYVIIDSITALLKGCPDAGEERRQTHEIIRRLEDRFSERRLALTVLLAEHDYRSEETRLIGTAGGINGPSVEDYLADIVLRLSVRSLPLGRRSRILEIVKSQGVNMILGEHTWQIVSDEYSSAILRLDDFRSFVQNQCIYPGESKGIRIAKAVSWGGIIIFPRPRLITPLGTDSADRPSASSSGVSRYESGTPGLELNVDPGRITLITGPMGCGKTPLCKQFLEGEPQSAKEKRVLISFDVPGDVDRDEKFTRLHFTQSQFDLNVLVSHINWILDQGCDRIAFDGLSEWITLFDKPEAARILETLMLTVKRRAGHATSPRSIEAPIPSVFMTYEMALDDDPLAPAALGTAADNLVVVRQVPINDQLRQLIYVLKPRPGKDEPSHRHPGELVRTGAGAQQRLYVDRTSLEAYTGLLKRSGEVEPARVLVQLFAENEAEKQFNNEVVRRLTDQYAKRITLSSTTFSLSQIGSTLETAFGAGDPGEAFNLSIHSVDEWWLNTKKTGDFLLNLRAPANVKEKTVSGISYQNFWWFEVEKTFSRFEKGAAHAIPGYMDFGMFCVNLEAMDAKVLNGINKAVLKEAKKYKIRRDPSQTAELIDGNEQLLRKRWGNLLAVIPRSWVKRKGSWFEIGSKDETVLGFALDVTAQRDRPNLHRKPVFTFDSSTRETCACTLFELAWAFGASESFLARDNPNRDREKQATKFAFLFLQFMILEGLMPARSSSCALNHAGQPILLSRRWYATISKEREESSQSASENLSQENGRPAKIRGLIALPFMPAGVDSREAAITELLRDIFIRQYFWTKRARIFSEHLLKNGLLPPVKEKEVIKLLDGLQSETGKLDVSTQGLTAVVSMNKKEAKESIKSTTTGAIAAYNCSRLLLLALSELPVNENFRALKSSPWIPSLDDLVELAAWAAFRISLLFGQNGGKFPKQSGRSSTDPVSKAIYEARWVRYWLPDLDTQFKNVTIDVDKVIITGYVCTGSWMYGVGKDSRSAQIQAQILAELTSLDSAQLRADRGAGMPARKDFFYLNGEQSVKELEYLNWRELLRYGGARARLRDRVMENETRPHGSSRKAASNFSLQDPSFLYDVVHRELLACMRIADLFRDKYAAKKDPKSRSEAIAAVTKVADHAVESIFALTARVPHDLESDS